MSFPSDGTELAIFFQDGDMAVVEGGGAAMVHLDDEEGVEQFGPASMPGVVKGTPRLEYATAVLQLVKGSIVTVKEQRYEVRWTEKRGDGQISIAMLKKAAS